MLVCGCGRWMHTQGLDERLEDDGTESWSVRLECLGCGLKVGLEGPPESAIVVVDRLLWTDDALHLLDRMPPYVAPLYKQEVEAFARSKNRRVITVGLLSQARQGEIVVWDPEAEQRLQNVPAAVRAMARVELERTAVERGLSRVTVSLMEDVKARFFGMAASK